MIYLTDVRFIDKIVDDIDKNNEIVEKKAKDSVSNQSDYMLREIYAFANNSSKELDEKNAFSSILFVLGVKPRVSFISFPTPNKSSIFVFTFSSVIERYSNFTTTVCTFYQIT